MKKFEIGLIFVKINYIILYKIIFKGKNVWIIKKNL